MCDEYAVCVRYANKSYGRKANRNVILHNLHMTVPKGAIYGLLGASGCGKTTLLSCIVGRRRLDNGDIWVLGKKRDRNSNETLGPRIGYMPQETALYGEFTIEETLMYFGWIADMPTSNIKARIPFLIDFLQLPEANRLVKTLSGGQQRRVSFSATLIHQPEVLILDEPTVGVDPVLRQHIWDHLLGITRDNGTTIIMTTHYIEEARQANKVGLMRGGCLLAEDAPDQLIYRYRGHNLEDIFLKLSVRQNASRFHSAAVDECSSNRVFVCDDGNPTSTTDDDRSSEGTKISANWIVDSQIPKCDSEQSLNERKNRPCCKPLLKVNHMRALLWKNILWLARNQFFMFTIVVLPFLTTVLFCETVGHDPRHLPISVANLEVNDSNACSPPSCNSTSLSCSYLQLLEKLDVDLTYYDSMEECLNQVRRGKAWAALVFPRNFSKSLKIRLLKGKDATLADILSSTAIVRQDLSNRIIGEFIRVQMYRAFETFFKEFVASCNISTSFAKIPIKWGKPVYGASYPSFTDFAAPGVILTTIFFLAVALTGLVMIVDRKEGITDRALIGGISQIEILIAHVLVQFVMVLLQIAIVIVVAFPMYHLEQNGSLWLIFELSVLSGLGGMCFGFLISCVCDDEFGATIAVLGSFLPIILLSGIVCPVESMHYALQYLAPFLPLTQSTQSLRIIMTRGWNLEYAEVVYGFLSSVLWVVIYLGLSILLIKLKK